MTPTPTETRPTTRDRLSTVVLIILAGLGVLLCVVVATPFLPALTWALSLAVVAHPAYVWIARRVKHRTLAAALAVALIAVGLVGPTVLIVQQTIRQVTEGFTAFEEQVKSGEFQQRLEQNPKVARLANWARANFDSERAFQEVGESVQRKLGGWLKGTVFAIAQAFIALFVLFFLFRDHDQAVRALRWIMPLSKREADDVMERVGAMVYATIYGTFVVAAVQGVLGGLMFWILGLPTPLLWGVVMALVSLVPTLGAFVVWLPAAVVMAAQGEWVKAAVLGGWGIAVVGSIDNVLHPVLVGQKMRMHTVPVFIATVGGLFVFGAAGLVLGPVTFAFTLALLDVLRQRTVGRRSAQQPT
jgi:predicted PurR-regulated permease PerM